MTKERAIFLLKILVLAPPYFFFHVHQPVIMVGGNMSVAPISVTVDANSKQSGYIKRWSIWNPKDVPNKLKGACVTRTCQCIL